jgi:glycosyltransferase involved in cell wall biosynthesis
LSGVTELVTPLKPLEAMSMGKLVVGADVGGIAELIRDGDTGLLFRAGDSGDLERVLLQALSDAGLRRRLGARARAHVAQHREWRRLATRYLDVYAAATAAAARRPFFAPRAATPAGPGVWGSPPSKPGVP